MRPTELLLDPAVRQWVAGALAVIYAALCVAIIWRERQRRKTKSDLALAAQNSPVWLVAYASQTGMAEAIAVETGRRLHQVGLSASVVELNAVSAEQLMRAERALFVVSTYGEGDAPDNAALFASHVMAQVLELGQLHFGVLALGDASYLHYCGFGRALERWLLNGQAQPLQARIEVSCGDPVALASWQGLLSHLAGSSDAPDWTAPAFETWHLLSRECLNPDSQGAPLYELRLRPMQGELPDWASGDLAQLCVSEQEVRPREYSIASVPEEGHLRLLVRLHRDAQGNVGQSSGWLATAAIGSAVQLRVRPHRMFRLGENAERPLILIGNGSGLAGLRGHIKARALADRHDNWLIYGERNVQNDAIWSDELETWRSTGVLRRLDRVFSRDGQSRRYVQHVLQERSDSLRQWVADGAAIYVCGSRSGMAEEVDAVLIEALGEAAMTSLLQAGRYRRDVY